MPSFYKDSTEIADRGVLAGDLSSEERSPAVLDFLMKKPREITRNDDAVATIAHLVLREYPNVAEWEREEVVMERANRANLWFNKALVRELLATAAGKAQRLAAEG
jgi:hypothetical protein